MDNQPINPAEQPVQPIQPQTETPVAPVAEPAAPIAEPTAPITEPTAPIAEPAIEQAAPLASEPVAPAAEPVAPEAPAAAPAPMPAPAVAPKKSNGALIGIIVGVVVALLVGGFVFWSITSGNKGDDTSNNNSGDNSGSSTPVATIPADEDSSYFVKIGDKTFTYESKIADFAEAGYSYSNNVKDSNIPSGKYMIMIGGGYLTNDDNNTYFSITPYNDGSEDVKFPEAKVGKITVSQQTDAAKQAVFEKFMFYGDIHLDSTEEELLSAFGEPSSKSELEDYKKNPYTKYEFRGSTYQKFEFQVQDGKVSEIVWTNYGALAD